MTRFTHHTAALLAALSLPFATAAAVAAPALPGTVSVSSSIVALQDTDWDAQLSVQQYGGSAALTGVTVELFGSLAGSLGAESTDQQAATLTLTLASTIALALPTAGSPALTVTPQYAKVVNFSAFDGSEDFAGSSGIEVDLSTPVTRSASLSFTDAASLALFTGPGALSLHISARDGSMSTGAANYVDGYASQAGAYARVTYSFASAPVPEPANWALMAAGLGMLGVLASRRRVG